MYTPVAHNLVSKATGEDKMNRDSFRTEATQPRHKILRIPILVPILLLLSLVVWYFYNIFIVPAPVTTTAELHNEVTIQYMANHCLTPTVCGPDFLEKYAYGAPISRGGLSAQNVQTVSFVINVPEDGQCPSWQLPKNVTAKFTDASGNAREQNGSTDLPVITSCDPVFSYTGSG